MTDKIILPSDYQTNSDNKQPDEIQPDENPLLRKVNYTFPVEEIDKQLNSALMVQGKQIKMKGFRPGKIPLTILKKQIGDNVLRQILINNAGNRFQQQAKNETEVFASQPNFFPNIHITDNHYHVDGSYEVLPEVPPLNLGDEKLEIPILKVGTNEVKEMVEILREQNGDLKTIDAKAQKEHFIVFDSKTFIKETETVIEETSDRVLNLSTTDLLANIREGLINVVAGEKRKIEIKIPPTHPKEEYRDKDAFIEVTVKEVKELVKPPLDDAFFSQLGVNEGGLPAFEKVVGEHLEREVKIRLRNLIHSKVMGRLITSTEKFPAPVTMLTNEIHELRQQEFNRLRSENQAIEKIDDLPIERYWAIAWRRVTLGLIIMAWQKQHQIEITDDDFEQRLDELAQSYETPEEIKTAIRKDKRQMEAIRLSLLEDKIIDWVIEQVETTEKEVSLDMVLGRSPSISSNDDSLPLNQ